MIKRLARRLIGISGLVALFWATGAAALSCRQAAAIAEVDASVPAGLLLAIGIVESGRTDPTGNRSPWPWTINARGVGRFFDTAEAAVHAVDDLRSNGVQSIDIGCFQINLFHHPGDFADLASGFDPLTNAQAAARFLTSLHEEFGAWEPAVAAYHSRVYSLGAPYRDSVLAVWHGSSLPDRILLAGIHVWGPAGEIGLSTGPSLTLSMPAYAALRSRLPRVVTASFR